MRHNNGTCWDTHQICPCCNIELFPCPDFRDEIVPTRCNNLIKKELSVEKEPNYAEIIRIQDKRKWKLKHKKYSEYQGVVL